MFAAAAGVSFAGSYPLRAGTARLPTPASGPTTSPEDPNDGINRADCLGVSKGVGSDTRWQFAIEQPPIAYSNLEVWVRSDSSAGCSLPSDRGTTGLAPICAKVATFPASKINAAQVFEIPDSAFIGAILSGPHSSVDDASAGFSKERDDTNRKSICSVGDSQDPINLYISFILTSDAAGTLAGGGTPSELVYQTTYDLAGLPPPTITASGGDSLIHVSWDTGTTVPPVGLLGYKPYCYPIGKPSGAETDTGGETSGGGDAAGDAAPATPAYSDDEACLGAALPSNFAAGKIPDPTMDAWACGSLVSPTASELSVLDLENDVLYATAVVAVDSYGNSGPLSNVRCATPRAATGGASCSYSPIGHISGLATFGLCALGLVIRVARRRRLA